jgi:iron complex outermembrane receptor protein
VDIEQNSSANLPKPAELHRLIRRTMRAAGMSLALGALCDPAFAQQAPASANQPPADAQLQEVVVTGTMIRNAAPVGASLVTVGRAAIAETGAQTMQQILASVPSVTGFGSPGQGSQGSFDPSGTFAPTIHGLGASASNGTLILVDGHRMPLSGVNHTLADPNIIAPLMVERIEVLPDGASSTYGSDAVAGVINIITRKNFKGLEASGQYGFANGYNTQNGGLLWGDHFGGTSVMASYNYERRSSLSGSQRPWTAANHTAQGGGNFNSYNCFPASVKAGSSFYLYPYTNGPASSAPCDSSPVADLLPAESRSDLMVKISHAVGDRFSMDGDVVYSNENNRAQIARRGITATAYGPGSTPPGGAGQINPYFQGPPGATSETVNFDGDNLLGPGAANTGGEQSVMGNANLYWSLAGDWEATLGTTIGNTTSTYDQTGTLCVSCAYLAINGTTNSGGNPLTPSIPGTTTTVTNLPLSASNALDVWNPTAAGTAASVLSGLSDNTTSQITYQSIKDLTLKFDGTLIQLPGGAVKGAIGAEYVHYGITEKVVRPNNTGPASGGSQAITLNWGRDVKSVFVEALIPIFGSGNHVSLARRLDVDISGRVDDYSDFGSTKNPRFAIDWSPVRDLTLRGDYSRSFTAPALTSIGDNGVTAESGYTDVSNVNHLSIPNGFPGAIGLPGCTAATPVCVIGTPAVTGIQVNGPNSELKPETGKNWSAGFDWAPQSLHGLRLSVTYWNVQYDGLITSPLATFAVSSPSLSPLLTLYPGGATPAQIAAIVGSRPQTGAVPSSVYWIYSYQQQNALNLKGDGIDGELQYVKPTAIGTLSADFSESLKLKMMQQFGSGGEWFSVLNTSGFNTTFPSYRFTARLDLGWARSAIAVHLITNYLGDYRNWNGSAPFPLTRDASFAPIGGGQSVSSLATVDLFASYTLPSSGYLSGLQATLTVNNIADSKPPFFNNALGYDNFGSGNPIGRMVTVGLTKTW